MPFRPQAILFDAYGTLFDVYSVGKRAEALFPGRGTELSQRWRDKQVEYTRLRSMAGTYKPFWEITQDALRFCLRVMGLPVSEDVVAVLMKEYASLAAFPENVSALKQMRDQAIPLAIHSNGNPEMIELAVSSAKMTGMFDAVLSAHTVRCYKIDARVYQLACDRFQKPASEMLFVSSNGWDVCGATWFGFKTFWVNRSDAPPEELDVRPTYMGRTLLDVAALVC